MRIPRSKVYRAFPELDQFSDGQCAGYVRTALRKERGWWIGMTLGRWSGALILFAFTLATLSILVGEFGRHIRPSQDWVQHVLFIGAVVIAVFAGWLPSILIRDGWVRRAIQRHLRSTACPNCSYVILGLPVVNGAVICPECGETLILDSMGLTPEMILAATLSSPAVHVHAPLHH